jgi:hypothetical protein
LKVRKLRWFTSRSRNRIHLEAASERLLCTPEDVPEDWRTFWFVRQIIDLCRHWRAGIYVSNVTDC